MDFYKSNVFPWAQKSRFLYFLIMHFSAYLNRFQVDYSAIARIWVDIPLLVRIYNQSYLLQGDGAEMLDGTNM